MTERVKVASVLRPVELAVSVTSPEVNGSVGVPEIVHDAASEAIESPAGSSGEAVQVAMLPPVFVATSGVIGVPTTPETFDALSAMTGAGSPTEIGRAHV